MMETGPVIQPKTLREAVAESSDVVDAGWRDIAQFLANGLAEIARGRDRKTGRILSARQAGRYARVVLQEAREALSLYGPEA